MTNCQPIGKEIRAKIIAAEIKHVKKELKRLQSELEQIDLLDVETIQEYKSAIKEWEDELKSLENK
jgi:uncharacterized membrane protein (DUF106 family)